MFTRLSFARRNKHIKADDIARSELELGNCLSLDGAVDDNISAIDDVTLNLVGKDTLYGIALELLSDFLNHFSHTSIGSGLTDFPQGSLVCIPCSKNDVRLGT